MILDEKISFDEESEALEFKEWLAQFGCKAKISTIFCYFTEDVISGSIDTIDEWCSEMSIEDEERAPLYQLIQQKNSNVKCAVEAILEGRLAGDVLYTTMDQKISDAKLLSVVLGNQRIINSEFSSERFNDDIFNILPLSYIQLLLRDSNCISKSGDNIILTRDVTPGEIVNDITIDLLDLPERVEYPGLCNIFSYIPDVRYEVIFSLPSHILLKPLPLATKLHELGVSQTNITTFVDTFSLKSEIVQLILKIIEENTILSTEELNGKLRDIYLAGADEWGHSRLLIDPPVTQQFVFELRKEGYVTGIDKKLRIASKSGKKRRK